MLLLGYSAEVAGRLVTLPEQKDTDLQRKRRWEKVKVRVSALLLMNKWERKRINLTMTECRRKFCDSVIRRKSRKPQATQLVSLSILINYDHQCEPVDRYQPIIGPQITGVLYNLILTCVNHCGIFSYTQVTHRS